MHPYATDPSERQRVVPALVIASVLLALGLASFIQSRNWAIPWWVDAPSVLGFYGLLTALFNRRLWKIARGLGLVGIPNLGGVWEGALNSSHDNYEEDHPVTVEIEQTWDQMRVTFRTAHSSSRSTAASLLSEGTTGAVLTYTYMNEPTVVAKESMHTHRGTTYLTLRRDGGEEMLEGEYYTGRGRQSVGKIVLKRQSTQKNNLRKTARA